MSFALLGRTRYPRSIAQECRYRLVDSDHCRSLGQQARRDAQGREGSVMVASRRLPHAEFFFFSPREPPTRNRYLALDPPRSNMCGRVKTWQLQVCIAPSGRTQRERGESWVCSLAVRGPRLGDRDFPRPKGAVCPQRPRHGSAAWQALERRNARTPGVSLGDRTRARGSARGREEEREAVVWLGRERKTHHGRVTAGALRGSACSVGRCRGSVERGHSVLCDGPAGE